MTLEQLKAALKDLVKGLADLKTKAMAEDATAEDLTALEDKLAEIDALEKKIAVVTAAEKHEAAQSQPAEQPLGGQQRSAVEPGVKLKAMDKIALTLQAMLKSHHENGKKSWSDTAETLEKMGYAQVADEMHGMQGKANNSGTDSAGGFAVAEDFNTEIFDALMPFSAFLRGGPDIIPMPNGNYRQSGTAARPSAAYRGEGTAIAESQPTLREIDMSAKLLSGMVPVTNQLISYTQNRASQWAQRTLAQTMGIKVDTAGFAGSGSGGNPLGIFGISGIGTAAAATGKTPNQAVVDAALRPLMNTIQSYAMLGIGVAWVMPQRVKGYLEDMTDGNGNYIYRGLSQDNPTFKGYPVLVTGNLSTTGGTGTNETTIGLVSFGNILLGESGGLRLAISDEAAFVDTNGDTVSAFQNELTLVRATMEHDWTAKYNEAIQTLTAVQWGAP